MAKDKFEQLIEFVINENETEAKKLFHDIVVESSRRIYEDLQDDEMGAEGMVDEISDDHDIIDADEEGDNNVADEFDSENLDDEEGVEGEEGIEDRVMDLEDALDELKAQFDELVGQEADEEGHDIDAINDAGSDDIDTDLADDDFDVDDAEGIDSIDDEGEEGFGEASIYGSNKSAGETMREYVEKVTRPNVDSEGNEVGSGGKSFTVNKKSSQISGKNDMGGTTANIAQGKYASDRDSNNGPKKPNNAYSKGQKDVEGASTWENRPGANTKGYKDKKSGKTTEGSTTDNSVKVDKNSLNPGGKPGFKG